MKAFLPDYISTVEEAKNFLFDLHHNGEAFHPEDDAHTIIWVLDHSAPNFAECEQLNKLMSDIYLLKGNDGRHVDLLFDPCEYLLSLNDENFHLL